MSYVRVGLLLAAVFLTGIASAQSVPEGIHKDRKGPPTLCGVTAPAVDKIRPLVLALPDVKPAPGNDLYEAYVQQDPLRMWTFTKPAHAAHPAVVCRSFVEKDGSISLNMHVSCDASREQCDALFNEFEALNEKMKAEMNKKR